MSFHANISGKIEDIEKFKGDLSGDFISREISGIIQNILNGLYDEEKLKEASYKALKKLDQEKRFRIHKMFYRDYVGAHQKRIEEKIKGDKELLLKIFPDIHFNYLLSLAKYHDLVEGISPTGDIPTPLKYGLGEIGSSIFYRLELGCIDILSRFSPEGIQLEKGFPLRFLLKDAMEKTTLEAKILSAIYDKGDAFHYCIHEVFGGNIDGGNKKESIYTHVIPRYVEFFKLIQKGTHPDYTELSKILQANSSLIHGSYLDLESRIITNRKRKEIKSKARLHNLENLEEDIGLPSYHQWRSSVMKLEDIMLGNDIMNGKEILTKLRS